MIVYLIACGSDRTDLGERITQLFRADSRKVAPGQWLVAADMTPKAVADRIGLGDGRYGHCLVTGLGSYWGWHEKDVWDWIALKAGR